MHLWNLAPCHLRHSCYVLTNLKQASKLWFIRQNNIQRGFPVDCSENCTSHGLNDMVFQMGYLIALAVLWWHHNSSLRHYVSNHTFISSPYVSIWSLVYSAFKTTIPKLTQRVLLWDIDERSIDTAYPGLCGSNLGFPMRWLINQGSHITISFHSLAYQYYFDTLIIEAFIYSIIINLAYYVDEWLYVRLTILSYI